MEEFNEVATVLVRLKIFFRIYFCGVESARMSTLQFFTSTPGPVIKLLVLTLLLS